MKFNFSWKPLLWEELYVGGNIVIVMLGVCALISISIGFLFPKPFVNWQEMDIICYLVAYATTILLLLQVANSGEMHLSIPHRILTLPVNTNLIVAMPYIMRTILLIVFTILSRYIIGVILSLFSLGYGGSGQYNYLYIEMFRRFFPLEMQFYVPLVFPALVHVFVYTTLQFFCWLFILSPGLVMAITFLMVLGVLVFLSGGNVNLISKLLSVFVGYSPYIGVAKSNTVGISTREFVLLFLVLILYVSFLYFLSIEVVSRLRAGKGGDWRCSFSPTFSKILREFLPEMMVKRFSNGKMAQLWFEFKNNGFIILSWTLIFFLLFNGIYGLILFVLNIACFNSNIRYSFSPTVMVLTFPYIALVLSGVVWYLKIYRKMKRDFREGVFQLNCLPITRKERIYAFWLAGNINLLVTLLIVWAIEFTYHCWLFGLYVIPKPFFGVINSKIQIPFSDVWSFLPPLLMTTMGVTLFFGLIVWLIMFNPISLLLVGVLVICIVFTGYWGTIWGISGKTNSLLYHLLNIRNWVPTSAVFVIFLTIYVCGLIMFITYLYVAFRKQVLSRRETATLFFIFSLIVLSATPWYLWSEVSPLLLLGASMFLAGILVSAWIKTLFVGYGYRWGVGLINFSHHSEENDSKDLSIWYLFVGYSIPIIFVLMMCLSNFETDLSGKIEAYFRSNSLPVSLKEVNEKYHAVSDDENLCKKYYNLIPLYNELKKREMEYIQKFYEDELSKLAWDEDKKCLQGLITNYYKYVIVNDKPIPETIYHIYKGIVEDIYKELIQKLEEVASDGLKGGCYPIDLTQGFSVQLPHLGVLRDWVQILGLESIISVVSGEYGRMLRAFEASASIYKSLENEPVYVSQLVRIRLFRIMYENLEWILNHQELPYDVLCSLDEIVDSFSVPIEKRSIFNSALHTDLLGVLSFSSSSRGKMFIFGYEGLQSSGRYSWQVQVINSWLPVFNVVYPSEIEQMVGVNLYSILGSVARDFAQSERVDVPTLVYLNRYVDSRVLAKSSDSIHAATPPSWFYPIVRVTFPGLLQTIDTELRHYVLINLTKTAIAIEKFRVENSRLPETLEELVPNYFSRVPSDPWRNGEPVKYVKGEDFAYRLYSVGKDREDNGGIRCEKKLDKCDEVFCVGPMSVRKDPDVSGENICF